jgi:uncharacterized repeat protein (TIGR03803 family)
VRYISFQVMPAPPTSSLAFDSLRRLYGVAIGGSYFSGVVFRLSPSGHGNQWAFSTIYQFKGSPDGRYPAAALIFGTTGSLYGTTEGGGDGKACQGGCGTVFELTP